MSEEDFGRGVRSEREQDMGSVIVVVVLLGYFL